MYPERGKMKDPAELPGNNFRQQKLIRKQEAGQLDSNSVQKANEDAVLSKTTKKNDLGHLFIQH